MTRPRLVDLFCGAGGAAVGYHRAGFDIVGVDNRPQPNYPFPFIQGDALWFLGADLKPGRQVVLDFDAIHASPPCQAYSTTATLHNNVYPDLLGPVRDLLLKTGLPYVIENVVGAPLDFPVQLCGSSFGLGVRRHRWFECKGFEVGLIPQCIHFSQREPIDVTGTGARRIGARTDGKGGNSRKPRNLAEAQHAMGIEWMTREELSEAIPPAYTEFIGTQLLAHLNAKVAA